MDAARINGIRSIQAVGGLVGWVIPSERARAWRNARQDEPTLWSKHFRRGGIAVRGEIPTPSWLHAEPGRAS